MTITKIWLHFSLQLTACELPKGWRRKEEKKKKERKGSENETGELTGHI